MTAKLATLSMALLISTSTISAAQQLVEVEPFSGVSVGTGMIAKVACGNSNTVTLRGKKDTLDKIEVKIEQDTLNVARRQSAGSLFGQLLSSDNNNDGTVHVDVVTTGDISLIDLSTGASMKVADCAVNTSQLTVDASTGSDVNVEGITTDLTLDMSTGSMFNRRAKSFTVNNVTLDLSVGATAYLCGASAVRGDASTGAMVYVADGVNKSNVDLSVGADVTSKKCK